MILFTTISALLLAVAVVLLLDLTPERITDDLMRVITPKQSLRDKSRIAHKKKKSRRLTDALAYIQSALTATGKGGQFTLICTLSLFLAIGGAVFAVAIDNLLLVPILGAAFALMPFLYAKGTIASYEKHIRLEMETALSIITTSYGPHRRYRGGGAGKHQLSQAARPGYVPVVPGGSDADPSGRQGGADPSPGESRRRRLARVV